MLTEQPITDSETAAVERLEAKFGGGEETPDETQENAAPAGEEQPAEVEAEQPDEAQRTNDDSEDVDFEGLQLKLPKEAANKLKSAVEGYKDYTRKTQEVAEQRRVVEAQTRLLQEQQAFQASIIPELSQYQQIDAQLAEYRKVDWTALSMEQAMQYRVQFDLLKEKKEELGKQLQGKKQQFDQALSARKKELADAQAKAVKAAIPNWSEKQAEQASKAAASIGFTNEELVNNYDPRFVLLAHKAALWDQLQASKPGVTQRANSAPRVVKPGPSSTQPNKQIELMNFKKAVKNAPSESAKAKLIEERLAKRFG